MSVQERSSHMRDILEKNCNPEGVIVCVFADHKYTEVLSNWLRKQAEVSNAKPVVFCLDRQTQSVCEGLRAEHILVPYSGDWLGFMRHQMAITLEMLRMGFTPLISDIDAIWVRDPLPTTLQHSQDMVFSPGTIQPLVAHAKWGNVLCTGFFLLRPTLRTVSFIEEVSQRMNNEGDQPAINRLLIEKQLDFTRPDLYAIPFRNHDVMQSYSARLGVTKGLSVALLPNRLFQRLAEKDEPTPLIIHPIAPKTQEAKIEVLKSLDLWNE
ncbi:MAG: putative nucleotide-diphospho-sugar transferase [Pseudomonadota bacterium]